MKVTYLAYKLKITPHQLSRIAYDLNIRKYHNQWGEEFFKPKDVRKILFFFKQAAEMKISPLFLLSTLNYRQSHII